MRILRKPDVLRTTGLSASTLERMEARGEFPRRVRLSAGAIGWREDEILSWIEKLLRGGPGSTEANTIEQSSESLRQPTC